MLLTKKIILFLLIVLSAFKSFSQKRNDTINEILPMSIFSSSQQELNLYRKYSDLNSKYSINKALDLKGFKFVILDIDDIEKGLFSVSFDNLKKTPSEYIYDSYQKAYRNSILKSTFFGIDNLMTLPFAKQ